jgi:hypothetical protein
MERENGDDRLVVVLGTSHRLQGAEKREGNIDDPDYISLIEHLRSFYGIDFIFEEACELGPTAAQKLAERRCLKYRDIDPHPDKRHLYGLPKDTGDFLKKPFDFAARTKPEAHRKREVFWVEKTKAESFQAALVICGLLHTLSLSEKLISAGFDVHAHYYTPHDKLCRKMHSTVASSSPSS